MKKFLFVYFFICVIQVYAACPVDFSGENICTSNEKNFPQNFIQHGSSVINTEQDNKQSLPNLTPLNTGINNNADKMQYNSSCQFGVCLQDVNNLNNKNQ